MESTAPCPVRHEAWILNNWIPPTLTDQDQGPLVWFLNRIPLETRGFPLPEPGSYDLAVMDGAGHYDKISFTVIPAGS